MYLTTRNSYALGSRLSRLLDDAFGGWDTLSQSNGTAAWTPAVDIFEQENEIRIVAEVPGVSPEDVKISLEDDVLSINGTKRQVAEEKTERVHRYERTYGSFARSFTLPSTVDAGKITASYDQGVLTVTLPKAEQAKPRQIAVSVAKN